jgi:phospholipase/carboxylesterase
MPVLNDTELIEYGEWTLRVRAAVSQPARLLLLVHGWTGDENSMWVFARDLPPDEWVLAPRAPYVTEPGGYSWRPNADGDSDRPSLDLLRPAIQILMKLVDSYAASSGVDASRFDVLGFSQGAALASLLGMLHPGRIRKLGILAGFVPRGAQQLIARRPLEGKKVFVAHGTQDTLVPVERARRSVEMLEQAGAQVTYCEAEVGHKVSVDCMRALRAYLQD